jgi:hypothetical protein
MVPEVVVDLGQGFRQIVITPAINDIEPLVGVGMI